MKRIAARTGRHTALALFLPALTMLASGLLPPAPQQCPPLTLKGPESSPPNRRLFYDASPDVGLRFDWTAENGDIESGQGKARISVINLVPNSTVVIAVENPGCNNRVTKTTDIRGVPVACPSVDVSCPDTVTAGEPITFRATINGGDPDTTPTFNWTVSAGTITSGQGTRSITVDTAGLGGQTVTATVDVGGYERSCVTSDSCTAFIVQAPVARKIDAYGVIPLDDEKARLDNFAIELQNDPTAQGYIIAYGGRRGRAGEAQRRSARARDYLVNTRGIAADRVMTVDGGFREELTVELWLVPAGATPPSPSPTGDPAKVRRKS